MSVIVLRFSHRQHEAEQAHSLESVMGESVHSAEIASRGGRVAGLVSRCLLRIAAWWYDMTRDLYASYRPERHYMRGPGPKWHERNSRGPV
jgi:hypothetical protein